MNQAKIQVLRINQQENFPTEYEQLTEQQSLLKINQLQNLAPFFDPDYNVIRAGSRLIQSLYSENKKFPILVSKNSKIVNLIIRLFHEASVHGGTQLTLNLIGQEYWITQAKPSVNNFIKHCLTCFRFNTSPTVQLMGDLPTERITPFLTFHTYRLGRCWTLLGKDRCSQRGQTLHRSVRVSQYQGCPSHVRSESHQKRLYLRIEPIYRSSWNAIKDLRR